MHTEDEIIDKIQTSLMMFNIVTFFAVNTMSQTLLVLVWLETAPQIHSNIHRATVIHFVFLFQLFHMVLTSEIQHKGSTAQWLHPCPRVHWLIKMRSGHWMGSMLCVSFNASTLMDGDKASHTTTDGWWQASQATTEAWTPFWRTMNTALCDFSYW